MLFYRKDVAGVALTAANFGLDYFGDATPFTNSIRNINNKNPEARYIILKRGKLQMKETLSGVTEYIDWHLEYRHSTPRKTSFTLGPNAIESSIDSGAWYLYMYTDAATTVGNGIVTLIEGNLWFRDQV